MKTIVSLTFFFLACFTASLSAQNSSCIVTFTTVINNKPLILKSNSGVLVLNTKSGDLTLTVNSASFVNETDTFTLAAFQQEENIVFTGNIGQNILQVVNPQSSTGKIYPITGTLSFNASSLQMIASYSALKINNSRDDLTKNLKMSLYLPFTAKSAKLNKYNPSATGEAMLQVIEGTTNIVEE